MQEFRSYFFNQSYLSSQSKSSKWSSLILEPLCADPHCKINRLKKFIFLVTGEIPFKLALQYKLHPTNRVCEFSLALSMCAFCSHSCLSLHSAGHLRTAQGTAQVMTLVGFSQCTYSLAFELEPHFLVHHSKWINTAALFKLPGNWSRLKCRKAFCVHSKSR